MVEVATLVGIQLKGTSSFCDVCAVHSNYIYASVTLTRYKESIWYNYGSFTENFERYHLNVVRPCKAWRIEFDWREF